MRQMYIILSVVGWAWLAVLAIVFFARRRFLTGSPPAQPTSADARQTPQVVHRP